MRKVLTASFIKIATAEPGKDRSIFWDASLPGFGLMVTHSGARSYVVQYRSNGESRRYTFDAALALPDARKEARKRMGEVAKGGDPVLERRQQIAAKRAATSGTLEFVAREYFKRERKAIRTMAEREATFERLVFPTLGKRQIGDIRRADLVRLLDHIADTRGPAMADMTLLYLSRLFNWHAARTDDFRSPIVRGMRRRKAAERIRTRVLTDDEIRAVWNAASARPGPFNAMVKFLLLTATRRNEAAAMPWSEIDGDVWTIPARRYKTGHDCVLPLSKAAQAVLAEVPRIGKSQFVFSHSGALPITGFSRPKRGLDKACGVTGWTLHDLRRTARSLMSRAGVPPDHAERCLGHVIGGVRGVYDRHEYLQEKREALESLAALVAKIAAS